MQPPQQAAGPPGPAVEVGAHPWLAASPLAEPVRAGGGQLHPTTPSGVVAGDDAKEEHPERGAHSATSTSKRRTLGAEPASWGLRRRQASGSRRRHAPAPLCSHLPEWSAMLCGLQANNGYGSRPSKRCGHGRATLEVRRCSHEGCALQL